MQEAVVKTRKLGGSLFVRIPKEIADKEGISEGEDVNITVTKPKKTKKNWFGVFKGRLGPFTKADELDVH